VIDSFCLARKRKIWGKCWYQDVEGCDSAIGHNYRLVGQLQVKGMLMLLYLILGDGMVHA
jgi:hypothetical protein